MKLYWFLFLLLLLPVATAQIQTLGYFEQNTCVELKQVCGDCTYNNITSVSYPNSTRGLNTVSMNKNGAEYNYTYCSTSVFGEYVVNGFGDVGGTATAWAYNFFITPNGEPLKSDTFLLFIYIVFGILIFGLLFTFILNLAKLSTVSFYVMDVAWSWGIYFLMVFLWWMTNDFIVADFLRSNIDLFLKITTFSHVILPLVAFVVTLFVRITEKKSNLSIDQLTGKIGSYYG